MDDNTDDSKNQATTSAESSASAEKAATPSLPPIVSSSQPIQAHAVRFGPGTDLVPALLTVAAQVMDRNPGGMDASDAASSAPSCCILTAVGSLEYTRLRMASATNQPGETPPAPRLLYKELHERVEIVSLVGTLSADSMKHLHKVRMVYLLANIPCILCLIR